MGRAAASSVSVRRFFAMVLTITVLPASGEVHGD